MSTMLALLPALGCSFNFLKGDLGGQFSCLSPAETQTPVAEGDGLG